MGRIEITNNRESNIELFRIVATLLVLIVHFTGWLSGGMSNIFDSQLTLSFRIGQTIMEAISIVCVNSFLIISGWYGVKLKLKSLWKIYILLVSIYIPVQMIDYLLTGHFSIVLFIDNILAFTRESYFVQCYLMFVFLSPIINSFIEKYKKMLFSMS